MTMNSFRPETLTVPPGTTVTFDNTSSHTHTVTAFQDAYPEEATYWSSGEFETEQQARDAWTSGGNGGLEPGESFEHTFEFEGTYAYFCIPHYRPDQGMTMEGTISVESEQ
jgi:plastocyanin